MPLGGNLGRRRQRQILHRTGRHGTTTGSIRNPPEPIGIRPAVAPSLAASLTGKIMTRGRTGSHANSSGVATGSQHPDPDFHWTEARLRHCVFRCGSPSLAQTLQGERHLTPHVRSSNHAQP